MSIITALEENGVTENKIRQNLSLANDDKFV